MATPKKVALVTGSTSGIGLATARALAKRGVNIIITGFGDEKSISSIVDEMRGYGVRANYVHADLSNVTEIDTLWSEVTRLYPDGIDILINCAGKVEFIGTFIGDTGDLQHVLLEKSSQRLRVLECLEYVCPIENFPGSQWNLHMDVLLTSPYHLIKRCLPTMKTKGWGRIVNISSVAGVVGFPNCSAYVSAKHGLIGLTKSVALESAAHGVTCNAVCPSAVETPMMTNTLKSLAALHETTAGQVKELYLKSVPTGKVVQPEQVAELVEFLCLSNASSQMTGASYLIDGGSTAQ